MDSHRRDFVTTQKRSRSYLRREVINGDMLQTVIETTENSECIGEQGGLSIASTAASVFSQLGPNILILGTLRGGNDLLLDKGENKT